MLLNRDAQLLQKRSESNSPATLRGTVMTPMLSAALSCLFPQMIRLETTVPDPMHSLMNCLLLALQPQQALTIQHVFPPLRREKELSYFERVLLKLTPPSRILCLLCIVHLPSPNF